MVTVLSYDGDTFEVTDALAKESVFFRELTRDELRDDLFDDGQVQLPHPSCTSSILRRLANFVDGIGLAWCKKQEVEKILDAALFLGLSTPYVVSTLLIWLKKSNAADTMPEHVLRAMFATGAEICASLEERGAMLVRMTDSLQASDKWAIAALAAWAVNVSDTKRWCAVLCFERIARSVEPTDTWAIPGLMQWLVLLGYDDTDWSARCVAAEQLALLVKDTDPKERLDVIEALGRHESRCGDASYRGLSAWACRWGSQGVQTIVRELQKAGLDDAAVCVLREAALCDQGDIQEEGSIVHILLSLLESLLASVSERNFTARRNAIELLCNERFADNRQVHDALQNFLQQHNFNDVLRFKAMIFLRSCGKLSEEAFADWLVRMTRSSLVFWTMDEKLLWIETLVTLLHSEEPIVSNTAKTLLLRADWNQVLKLKGLGWVDRIRHHPAMSSCTELRDLISDALNENHHNLRMTDLLVQLRNGDLVESASQMISLRKSLPDSFPDWDGIYKLEDVKDAALHVLDWEGHDWLRGMTLECLSASAQADPRAQAGALSILLIIGHDWDVLQNFLQTACFQILLSQDRTRTAAVSLLAEAASSQRSDAGLDLFFKVLTNIDDVIRAEAIRAYQSLCQHRGHSLLLEGALRNLRMKGPSP